MHPAGIAVSETAAAELSLSPGEPVAVTGGREAVGVVESVERLEGCAAYLGPLLRANARANGTVTLRRLGDVPAARSVVLYVPGNAGIDVEEVRRTLAGLFVRAGDELLLPSRGLAGERAVADRVLPDGVTQITADTQVRLRKSYGEPGKATGFADIGGSRPVLEEVKALLARLDSQPLLEEWGARPVRGVVIYGPHGAGKTMLLDGIARESGLNVVRLSPSDVVGLAGAEVRKRIQGAFADARKDAPSVILMDDLDMVSRKCGENAAPEERGIAVLLRKLLDDLGSRNRVMLIATAEDIGSIDRALRRPGRIDKEIEIPLPDVDEREDILRICTARMPMAEDVDLTKLAAQAGGCTGADLDLVCSDAAWWALCRDMGPAGLRRQAENRKCAPALPAGLNVRSEDFQRALKDVRPAAGRELVADVPQVRWEDVGGYRQVKEEIERQVVGVWANREAAGRWGVEMPRGLLFYGPPGTGKTWLAQGLASRLKSRVIPVKCSDLIDKYLGESEKNVARVFQVARRNAPVIVVLDEVDSIAARRGCSGTEGGRAMDNALNVLLCELDGSERLGDVLVVAITNRKDRLDEAFLRSNRVGWHIHVGLPDAESRRAIFEVHLRKAQVGVAGAVLAELVERTDGLVAADIREIVRRAKGEAFAELIGGGSKGELVVDSERLREAAGYVARGKRDAGPAD